MNATTLKIAICALLTLGLINPVWAEEEAEKSLEEPEQVIKPQIERRNIKLPRIDTEDFEIGPLGGVYSMEGFGAHPLLGVRLDYHVSEDFFFEMVYAQTSINDDISRNFGVPLFVGGEETVEYYNLTLAYNLFPGEVFVASQLAFNSSIYVSAGVGVTSFAEEDRFTFNGGFGFRMLATDWLSIRFDVQDHIFESDILAEQKLTHNISFSGGLSLFF